MKEEFYRQWITSERSQEEKTEQLVEQLFQGHVDLAGKPYLEHLYYVRDHFSTSTERIVALLHDVLEDTDFTCFDLERLGYSKEVIDAVTLLTRAKDQSYENYIDRLLQSECRLAIRIKYVDLLHNMDVETRFLAPSKKDYERVLRKYLPALEKIVEYLEMKEG